MNRAPGKEADRFLTIDIGGSGLKAAVVTADGTIVKDRVRVKTPQAPSADELVSALADLVEPLRPFEYVSVGFPGVVKDGIVVTAPNLGTERLEGLDLREALTARLGVPTRVVNDAVLQGYAVVTGQGVELVLTLGTGFGAVVFNDGVPLPVFELAHHPFRKGDTYEEQLGRRALDDIGRQRWSRRLERALEQLYALLHYDRAYLGGGNAGQVRFTLDERTTVVSNAMGVRGGAALWGA